MPVKALPAPMTPWVFDVHGFADVTVATNRITGAGLLLYPVPERGVLVQPSLGLALDIYKDPKGFINSFSVFGGTWDETWTKPPAGVRHWQEMDWWAGFSVGFAQHWKVSAQHLEFLFPGGTGGAAINDTATLSFDDSYLGWPITINPYVDVFYNERGGSLAILGKTRDAVRFDIGMTPTFSFLKPYNVPLILSAPTWVTVGPSNFWNRNDGTTNFCGPLTNAPCSLSSVGYVSTGLQAKYLLDTWVPKRLGSWYVKGGVQYYHIVNDALLAAQTVAGGDGAVPNFPSAKRDYAKFSTGAGFSF
jgi:hypothetical protein